MKLITTMIAAGLLVSASGQTTSNDKTKTATKTSQAKKTDAQKTDSEPGTTMTITNKDQSKVRIVQTKPVPPSTTIPPDAKQLEDGSFRYVDKDGKKWIYRNTPFGVSKSEERPAPPVAKPEDDPVSTEDLGDSVRFTRATPFGKKVWTARKAQLDDYEKAIWERDQHKSGGGAAR